MGGGGGWDPGEDLKNLAEDPVGTIASGLVNYGTFGLVGYEDGKLKAGVTTRATDEGIGEISGRNLGREAAQDAKNAIAEQKVNLENQRLFDLQKQESQERQMSNSNRRRNSNSSTNGSTGVDVQEQQMASQWLGL